MNKSKYLLKLLADHINLIELSLNANFRTDKICSSASAENDVLETDLNDPLNADNVIPSNECNEDERRALKELESSIESKLLSIEIIKSIVSFYADEGMLKANFFFLFLSLFKYKILKY
jgi:hypothetical protein